MTSESSDLERTEEGVGRSEMVGVEGDRVPIIVVEVEGRNERCYDVDAEIVSEVRQYESKLETRDSLDDTEWERRDAEVELLSSWKAKKANQNKYSLNEDEEEKVGKLVKEGGKLVNIMYLTNVDCIEAVELYGSSALSEVEMDKFLNAVGGLAIPKKRQRLQLRRGVKWELGRRRGAEVLWGNLVKHALEKEKEELEKKNKDMQEALDEVVPTVKQLEQEKDSLSTKLVFEKKKRKISESEREAQEKEIKAMKEVVVELKKNVQLLIHNGMEEHINNFINSSSFDNIINLYRLPTAILAFTDCRKKVKAKYPEVDIMKITFSEQEEGVEENGETMEEEEAEVKGVGVEENQQPHPVEVHSIPSNEEQPPQSAKQPPLPSEQQPPQPPPQ
ncbi:hypothetical protein SLEP1_g22620 [Rubroshorea leprosula]|uniref:Uncharacterized protein n=1 Tax=Rubroshorea leprosula TaxID=152421 RepID=A0AAV5JFW0_9ROSI|nr:hypothetical protein SLEP1_g22620 [Rubroshorea leprosula]